MKCPDCGGQMIDDIKKGIYKCLNCKRLLKENNNETRSTTKEKKVDGGGR